MTIKIKPDPRADDLAARGHAEAMAQGWELMQQGLKMPGNSTATFVRGENQLRAAVASYRKNYPKVKTTRCLLCKARVRCVAVGDALYHEESPDIRRLCRDPAARGYKPSRPPRRKVVDGQDLRRKRR